MPEVYVAAGSNVAPEKNLARAVAELSAAFPGVRFSPWYRNRAVGLRRAMTSSTWSPASAPRCRLSEVLAKLHAIETRVRPAARRAALGAALDGPGRAAVRGPGVR